MSGLMSSSIELIFVEKVQTILNKLDNALAEYKTLNDKVEILHQENIALKSQNENLNKSIKEVNIKLNQLEEQLTGDSVIINGVKESYAERADPANPAIDGQVPKREDTLITVIDVFEKACGVTVSTLDLKFAYRIRSKAPGPRPLPITSHSTATRANILSARKKRKKLSYNGTPVFMNDHLTYRTI